MNRTILYYPTITIPKKDWLRNALLYWDQVSSIVPDDNRVRNTLPGYVDYLADEGVFRAIKPEDLYKEYNWEKLEQFVKEFEEVVDSQPFQQYISRQYRVLRPSQIHANKLGDNSLARIHENKTTHGIYHFLRERNLIAERRGGDGQWLYMERRTALLYMSLLAKYLAFVDKNHVTVGTDIVTFEQFNFKKVSSDKGFPIVTVNLNNVLPTPNPNTTVEQIVTFRNQHIENLKHFRKMLSDFYSQVPKLKTQEELKDATVNFRDNLNVGVTDLAKALKSSKIDFGLKTLRSLLNVKSPKPWIAAAHLVATKYNLAHIPWQFSAVGIAAVGAVELGANYIENRNKDSMKIRESPFSYIYKAQQAGIIRPI